MERPPFQPEVRAQLLELVRHLVTAYDVDGIHLDCLRYPSLQADRSPEVIAAFGATVGLPDLTVDEAVSIFYTHWTEWRAEQLAERRRYVIPSAELPIERSSSPPRL